MPAEGRCPASLPDTLPGEGVLFMDKKRALLFVNGELPAAGRVAALIQPDDFLVAVDGGLEHLKLLQRQPHLLIGDLDSVSLQDVVRLETAGVPVERFPVEKDESDLELALDSVVKRGYRTLRIIAGVGGRLDQTLANLFLLARPHLADCDLRLDDGQTEVLLVRQSALIEGQPGETVSLLPLGRPACGVTTLGLRYPLHAETLWPDRTRGVSNALAEPRASIRLHDGLIICVHLRFDL